MVSDSKNQGKPERATNGEAGNARHDDGKADIGDALRTAYENTVNEDIPAEMIDLLGKLD